MIGAVADTHTAVWYLFNDSRISNLAGDFIDQAAAGGKRIAISAISLAEIVYLVEKGRLPHNAYVDLKTALEDPDHVFKEVPFTIEVVESMRKISRADVPDMPDRIVAATAVYLAVPVLSRDNRIHSANLRTVW
jgi:PIN domain nuclease of toxin-antitoxin system